MNKSLSDFKHARCMLSMQAKNAAETRLYGLNLTDRQTIVGHNDHLETSGTFH